MRSLERNGSVPDTYGAIKRTRRKPKKAAPQWSEEKGLDMLLERLLTEIREERKQERVEGERCDQHDAGDSSGKAATPPPRGTHE